MSVTIEDIQQLIDEVAATVAGIGKEDVDDEVFESVACALDDRLYEPFGASGAGKIVYSQERPALVHAIMERFATNVPAHDYAAHELGNYLTINGTDIDGTRCYVVFLVEYAVKAAIDPDFAWRDA